jgi:RNA methyltransferase, TrmH family
MISKQKIELIRSLKDHKVREKAGLFAAEGSKLVLDLLKTSLIPTEIFVTSEGLSLFGEKLVHPEVIRISDREMERISSFRDPSPVLALFRIPPVDPLILASFRGPGLVLDGVQDPGNLGTIVRTADWFGIPRLFCSADCADVFNPKCVQATMGALARVQVHYLDLSLLLQEAGESKIPVYGAYMEGESVFETELSANALILMGSEGKGISPELSPFVTKRISIPSYPVGHRELESLNVAVSAAIVCSEFRRRMNLFASISK